jgi:transcriptional regulator with XRE-family HTH domain
MYTPDQREIAQRLGLAQSTISLIFNGHRHAGRKAADAISALTGKPYYKYERGAKTGAQIKREVVAAIRRERRKA